MTFAKLLASITKAPPRTAAQLRDALAKIDLPALQNRVAEIESERRGLLLRGTDAELRKNKDALDAASLDVERAQAATEELNRQIVEAEAREGAAEIEEQAAAAEAAVGKLSALYGKIDTGTVEMQQLFAEALPLAATITAWNHRAHKLGRPRVTFTEPAVIKTRTIGAIRV